MNACKGCSGIVGDDGVRCAAVKESKKKPMSRKKGEEAGCCCLGSEVNGSRKVLKRKSAKVPERLTTL